jgi:hypothetical protein
MGDVDASAGESVKAAQLLLSYAYGRPPQAIEISGPDGSPIETRTEVGPDLLNMTTGEQRRYLAELEAQLAQDRIDRVAAMTEDEFRVFLVNVEAKRKALTTGEVEE